MSPYAESLRYLYGLQRFGIKLGLENISQLLERLGRPQLAFPVVHVAGTNGKGSVCATLAALLQASNLRTGLYTSPHLQHFGERIRVSGEMISESQMVALTEELRGCCDQIPATFFEFTTAMALEHFRQQRVDLSILETGMGGRLDATNVVSPVLTIITPLSLDHGAHLGTTLTQIAAEKGGIIKPGVPLILAHQEPEALAVLLDIAQERKAPVLLEGRDFQMQTRGDLMDFHGASLHLSGLRLALEGQHQRHNAALALAAWECLRAQGTALYEQTIPSGLSAVHWPGRLQWCGPDSRVLLDGAHNAAGARALATYLDGLGDRSIHWVAGFKADKEVRDMLELMLPRIERLSLVPPPVEDSYPVEQALAQVGGRCPVSIYGSLEEALTPALARSSAGDVLLIAGSLFLVAEALNLLEKGSAA